MPDRIADDAAYIAKRMKELGLTRDEGPPPEPQNPSAVDWPEVAVLNGSPGDVAKALAEYRGRVESAFYLPSGLLRGGVTLRPVLESGYWPIPKR